MSSQDMTYHESYGMLRTSTLRLIRRFNVSPADLDLMLDLLGFGTWDDIDDHIRQNSSAGYYVGRTF